MTVFRNLDEFLALPRVSGLIASPDGARVVATTAELNDSRTDAHNRMGAQLHGVSAGPSTDLGRVSRSSRRRSPVMVTCASPLAANPTAEDDESHASLWLLPAAGGAAVSVPVTTRPYRRPKTGPSGTRGGNPRADALVCPQRRG